MRKWVWSSAVSSSPLLLIACGAATGLSVPEYEPTDAAVVIEASTDSRVSESAIDASPLDAKDANDVIDTSLPDVLPDAPTFLVARKISAGYDATCALTSSNGAACWGSNDFGGLGNNSLDDSSLPVNVVGLGSNVSAIFTRDYFACALTDIGGVKCWGVNVDGQLGDGTRIDRATPVNVVGLNSGISAISMGYAHVCAVTNVGSVKCWGNSGLNLSHSNTNQPNTTPLDVPNLSSIVAVAAGYLSTCVLSASGGVQCWGMLGEYGGGPADVPALTEKISAIASGYDFACALNVASGVSCWGVNDVGQLGNGTTFDSPSAIPLPGLTSGVAAISVGGSHACALMTAGGVKCWGANESGQLGNNSTVGSHVPVDVEGLDHVKAISAGYNHTCAITASETVKCWGFNVEGGLGNGTFDGSYLPVDVLGLE